MGQKVHPIGFRLGIKVGERSVKDWNGRWFATGKEYSDLLLEDVKVRQHIMTRMADAGVAKVEIERSANMITVTIHAAKPGIVIGKSGVKVEELRRTLEAMTGKRIRVTIQEIRQPETNAMLVARSSAARGRSCASTRSGLLAWWCIRPGRGVRRATCSTVRCSGRIAAASSSTAGSGADPATTSTHSAASAHTADAATGGGITD